MALTVTTIAAGSGTSSARFDDFAQGPGLGSEVHLVLLSEPPVAGYAGGIGGYAATRPRPGKKLDRRDGRVQDYAAYLRSRQDSVARSVGATRVYDYQYALNGFAAALTSRQVAALQASAAVVSIQRDHLAQLTTDNAPRFLGLNASGGLWSRLGGIGRAGEDVVVGVVDTGIWPEHPSFAANGYGPAPDGWNGACQAGELWSIKTCNGKLVGARYFEKGYGHFFGDLARDYQSARDSDGHGTHTASTAAGNSGVAASVLGTSLGTVSGIAPRARVAAYKACWPGGCAVSDLIAAIDAAVSDGVDVINYSIGDGDPDLLDADDVAFLFARQAGVFVAASAGNSGPGASTVDHGGPWLTTVAASTQDRTFAGTVTTGDGQSFDGVTITPGLPPTRLVDGAAAGSQGCLSGLDPTAVRGAVVLCRGSFSRAARSLAVKNAGGAGMILYTAAESDALLSDTHHVPTLHVRASVGAALRTYAAGPSPEASLSGVTKQYGGGNTMAAFSSRGPLLPGPRSTGDLLKPDVTAPGVQILAGNTPTASVGAAGNLFQAIAGTSMSSPHVAGLGALLKDLHPDWTPDLAQSAIMTSARQDVRKEDAVTAADPFDFGAGHIVPNRAADPGLVHPTGLDDYRAFLRSQGACTLCFGTSPAPVVAPADLNVPSVTIRALAGTQTVRRTVRNVGAAGVYSVSTSPPPGIEVEVSPTSLDLATGETATYEVSVRATDDARFDQYAFGSLTWSDDTHRVRIPLVVRPVQVSAPASLSGTGTSGSLRRPVTLGYSGAFSVEPQGLVAPTTEARTVNDDPTNDFDTTQPDANQGVQVHTVAVAPGTTLARFALFDEQTDGDDDLDLFLYRIAPDGTSTLVGQSAGATSAERIELAAPAAGTYRLYVHGWQTDGRSANYTLFHWLVPSTGTGNLVALSSTSTATNGAVAEVTASWSGLAAGTTYLGRLSYRKGTGEIGATLLSVTG